MGLFGPPNVEKMKGRGNVEGLIKALSYKKKDWVRSASAKALGDFTAQREDEALRIRVINSLIPALKDGQYYVREAAAGALGKIGARLEDTALRARVVEALVPIKKYATLSAAVAGAMGQIGGERAIEVLTRSLMITADPAARQAAALALGKTGDPRVINPLILALHDHEENVRVAAANSLVSTGMPAVQPLITALHGSIENRTGSDKLDQLEDEYMRLIGIEPPSAERKKYYTGYHVMFALGLIGINLEEGELRQRAIQALLAVLNRSLSAPLRQAAGEALDRFGWQPESDEAGAAYWISRGNWDKCVEIGRPATHPLMAVLGDRQNPLRINAAGTLDRIGWQPEADENGAVFWIVTGAWDRVAKIGLPALDPLLAELADKSSKVREPAIQALGEICAQHEETALRSSAIEALIPLLTESTLCSASAAALVKIGAAACDPLIAFLKEHKWQASKTVLTALGQIGQNVQEAALRDRTIEAFTTYLKEDGNFNCKLAVYTLRQFGEAGAVPALITVLKENNRNANAREDAASALGQIGESSNDTAIRTSMVEPLIHALKDNQNRVAYAAASALGLIGPRLEDSGLRARAAEALIDELSASNKDIQNAAGAIGQIGDPRGIDPLIVLLGNSKLAVRKTAAEALVRLYQSGLVDASHKQRILVNRDRMAASHQDKNVWISNGSSSDCTGNSVHTDNNGIGVSFSV